MIKYGLEDRVICVTGGGSGIGLSVVQLLARDGARVAILDRDKDSVERAVTEAQSFGAKVGGYILDVRIADALHVVGDKIESDLGPVYGLVVSAGISGAGKAEDLLETSWTELFSINVSGLFLTCQEFGRRMIKAKKGSIVTIGSVDGIGGHPGRSHYVASKFAVRGLTQNLALEWGRHNVRVNCVAPSFVDTPLLRKNIPSKFIEDVVNDRTPLGRFAQSEEVAAASLMLLSDAASYISGVTLPVDGGLTAGPFTHKQGADLSSQRLLDEGAYKA
jgi:NAD(P)-dependent dehydrogenase (short-subunit alcohol dehydrogenase family)